MDNPRAQICKALKSANSFFIFSHLSPDGDAIASSAAMALLLERLGKKVTTYIASGLPEVYSWLAFPGKIINHLNVDSPPDWCLVLDCGNEYRLGMEAASFIKQHKVINIDHHLENSLFGEINWCEPSFASTSQMIGELVIECGESLDGSLAEAVYTGLVTDTGSFSFGNSSAQAHRMTAQLIDAGLDPGKMAPLIHNQWTKASLNVWSTVLGQIRIYDEGRVGVISLTLAEMSKTGATASDLEGLPNAALRLRGMLAAVFIREIKPEVYKLSLRSTTSVDIRSVALLHNGGGHANAAGCVMEGDLKAIETEIVEQLTELLHR